MSQSPSPLEAPPHWTPEPIRAWRGWYWGAADNRGPLRVLQSLTMKTPWLQRHMPPATCHPHWSIREERHETPHPDCMCGYYGLKPELLARPEAWSHAFWAPEALTACGVLGWIQQSGVVDEYEHGYRSQHVKIESFIMLNREWCEQYLHLWLEETSYREHLITRELEGYRRRVTEVAEGYRVPVVDIG